MSQMRLFHPTRHRSIVTCCFAVICVLLATGSAWATDSAVEAKIKTIRARYVQIEKGLKDCRQVKRELPGESAEGGELVAYFKDRSVEKLSAAFFGETGKALEEYYFWNSELIFVLRVESHYTKPMSGVVKNKTEERFYFADSKLIRWLSPDNKDVTSDSSAAEHERELLASATKYKTLANQ
jgi:hypothetical protein